MSEPNEPLASDLLARIFQEIDPRRAQALLAPLRTLPPEGQQAYLTAIEARLGDAEAMRRRRAAQVLGWLAPVAGIPLLLRLRSDPSWVVREAAVLALASYPERPAEMRQWLVEVALFDRHAQVRTLAGRALAVAGEGLSELVGALEHPHFSVRCRALHALAFFGAQAEAFLPQVIELLTSSHRKVRQAAAECVGRLEGAGIQGLPGLVRRLFDQEDRVARTAREAIGRLYAHLSPALQGWLDALLLADGHIEQAVGQALARTDLPPRVAAAFGESCRKRVNWYRRQRGQPLHEGPLTLAELSSDGLDQAGAMFGTPAARTQEAAWQAALLLESLTNLDPRTEASQ